MIRRDERGFGVVEILIGAAIVAATGYALGTAIHVLSQDAYGSGGPHYEVPAQPGGFAAPPDNECGRRVLDLFKGDVTYGADGWQSTEMRKPTPPTRPDENDHRHFEQNLKEYNQEVKIYNGKIADWNRLMRIRVPAVYKELNEQDCYKQQTALPQQSLPPNPKAMNIVGRYSISWSGLDCQFDGWANINVVSITGAEPKITIAFNGPGSQVTTFELQQSGDSFEVNNEAAAVRVHFTDLGDKVQISGSYHYNGPEAKCSGLFAGPQQ